MPWNSTASDPLPPAVHDSALTQQPSNTVWISTRGQSPGRPWCPIAQGCPVTSPESSPRLQHLGLAYSLPSAPGNPRQKTKTLTSNSRALRQRMHLLPVHFATVCCLLVFSFFFLCNPFVSTRIPCQHSVQRKIVGGRGEERWGLLFNSSSMLINFTSIFVLPKGRN